jgi:hypothetical protein
VEFQLLPAAGALFEQQFNNIGQQLQQQHQWLQQQHQQLQEQEQQLQAILHHLARIEATSLNTRILSQNRHYSREAQRPLHKIVSFPSPLLQSMF